MTDTLPPLREVIAAHGLSAKKSLGHNFLFDLNLTRRIARAAGPLENTTIYEVGPGPGGLAGQVVVWCATSCSFGRFPWRSVGLDGGQIRDRS